MGGEEGEEVDLTHLHIQQSMNSFHGSIYEIPCSHANFRRCY